LIQCAEREIAPGPIASFNKWKERGRWVRKGQRTIALWMPITIKRTIEQGGSEPEQVAFTRFKGSLRRSTNRFVAPLIRPARFRGLAFIGAAPASSDAPLEREVQRYSRAGKEETAEQRADRPRPANSERP
jgi:hypothetical protein